MCTTTHSAGSPKKMNCAQQENKSGSNEPSIKLFVFQCSFLCNNELTPKALSWIQKIEHKLKPSWYFQAIDFNNVKFMSLAQIFRAVSYFQKFMLLNYKQNSMITRFLFQTQVLSLSTPTHTHTHTHTLTAVQNGF